MQPNRHERATPVLWASSFLRLGSGRVLAPVINRSMCRWFHSLRHHESFGISLPVEPFR
jgi:hypothetical protein